MIWTRQCFIEIIFEIRGQMIVMNKNHQTLIALEFKQSTDRNEDFLRVKEDEAHEQHKSILEALKAAAPELTKRLPRDFR